MVYRAAVRAGIAVVLFLAFASTWAQPGPWWEASLEATILNADVAAVGTLLDYSLASDGNTILDATFAIEEELKGDLPDKVKVSVNQSFRTFAGWAPGSAKMLLTRENGDYRFIRLSDPKLVVVRSDFTLLRKPKDILQAAREIVRGSPGVTHIETMPISAPNPVVQAFPVTGMGMYLDVPIDARLERRAVESIQGRKGMDLSQAATVLGHFKSDRNIELLKGLLADPTIAYYGRPNDNLGKGRRSYIVRKAAFGALEELGVQVARPLLEEEVYEPQTVTYAYLERVKDVSEQVKRLFVFKNLRDLYLSSTSLSHDDLRVVARLPHIKKLELSNTPITDAGAAEIAKMEDLEELNLAATKITSQFVARLGSMRSLRYLNLNGTSIDDSALGYIAKFRSLRRLSIANTAVSPKALLALKGMPNLEQIELPKPDWQLGEEYLFALRDAGLMHAFNHAYGDGDKPARSDGEVTRVMFLSEPVSDAGLAAFSVFRNLKRLALPASNIGDEGMKTVAGFRQLDQLIMNGTQVTDAGLRTISGLAGLEALGLANTKISDAGLDVVARFPKLRWLVVANTKVTDEGLAKLAGLKDLRAIIATDVNLTDAGLGSLAALPSLETLGLSGTKVTDEGVLGLAKIPTLRSLNLWRAAGVSFDTIVKLHKLRPDIDIQR